MRITIFLTILSVAISSCGSKSTDGNQTDQEEIRRSLRGANALLIDAEEQEIQDFINRQSWDMKETGSGLKYMIYEEGTGPKAEKDNIAHLHYNISLITGDLVYSSREDGIREFRIGKGGVEPGLEEGILLLRVGDKARFILPSHLAHGVPGDGVKIPRRATIIYDLELINITSK